MGTAQAEVLQSARIGGQAGSTAAEVDSCTRYQMTREVVGRNEFRQPGTCSPPDQEAVGTQQDRASGMAHEAVGTTRWLEVEAVRPGGTLETEADHGRTKEARNRHNAEGPADRDR